MYEAGRNEPGRYELPVYKSRLVLELARNLRAFLSLDAGLVRGPVPGGDQQARETQRSLEQARNQIANKDRRIEKLRRRLSDSERPKERPKARPTEKRDSKSNLRTIVGDPRDHFIGRVAKGKSFVDVGGLGRAVNEKVSVAHSHGATDLTMLDIVPQDHGLWRGFSERMEQLSISGYESVSGSILDIGESSDPPRYDVVHCTGVLYHMPDPIRFLSALRKITGEYLILGSAVTATRVDGASGTLEVPSSSALFVPALQDRERAILQEYWRPFVGEDAIGLTSEVSPWDPEDFTPWWWIPTVECMRSMCESAGFVHEDGASYWNGNAHAMLLSRGPGS